MAYGSTQAQEMENRTETYYSGPLSEASFTVPEGITRVLFQFRGPEGTQIRSLSLSDGTKIPTSYTLLPENLVSRFQKNLFQDRSFLLRVQYLKDGWTLFTQSPLTGHGLGATEGLLTSVQPFFYQSLYLHNHILQVMDETGLLGLAAFLALMLGAAWLLVRRLRTQQDGMAAVLLACWVMMNLHGLMEISFSVRMFQCAAFFLVLMSVVSCGGARGGEKRRADPPGRRDPGRRTLAGRFLCDAFGQPDGTGAIQGLRYDGYDPVGIPGQHGKAGSDGRLYRSGL